jgi:hypothetical protein
VAPLTLALLLEARHSRGNCCASHAQESQAGREG